MDNSDAAASSPAQKVINDENRKPGPKAKKRNIMNEKFRAYKANPTQTFEQHPYEYIVRPCFFYGTLTDPSKLQEVLQLPSLPVLRPARVKGYKIMLWGQYPALVDGPRSNYVDGMAYVVETEKHLQMLERYETRVYVANGIGIEIDGERVSGLTFAWGTDDFSALEEGTWSLEEWKRNVAEDMASHFRPVED